MVGWDTMRLLGKTFAVTLDNRQTNHNYWSAPKQ